MKALFNLGKNCGLQLPRIIFSILAFIVLASPVAFAGGRLDPAEIDMIARSSSDDKDKEKSSSKKDKKKKKEDKSSKAEKDDDDDEDGDEAKKERSDKKKSKKDEGDESENEADAEVEADNEVKEDTVARATTTRAGATAGLSAEARYIPVSEAIRLAREAGGTGEVLQIDLEWDPSRSITTCDVTFSSGNEYEFDAATGELLAKKPKSMPKLALLSPLGFDKNKWLTFQEIMSRAEKSNGQSVIEMELKQPKSRSGAIYEVVLANGVEIQYDAATGKTITGN